MNLWKMFALWMVALTSVGILAACAGGDSAAINVRADVITALSGEPDAGFARAFSPIEFNFPTDHGAHPEFQTEWWYYTGNLRDEQGRRFGFQFTIFRNAVTPDLPARTSDWATNQIYMAHFALTHVERGEHVAFERYSRGGAGLAGATGDPFAAWLENWAVETVEPGAVTITAATTDGETGLPYAIELTLRETRAPILHGDRGLSQKGPEPGVASYYYSLVNMETTGTIIYGDETVDVRGSSWMDHEFGTNALSAEAIGWDWFSLALDNDVVIMFAQIRARSGGRLDEFEGTLVYPDGRQESIRAGDFTLEPLGEWTSPATGITYPQGWQVGIPEYDIDLRVMPRLAAQEMNLSFIYWEGMVAVEGSMAGAPVAGEGYVELTGYGAEIGDYLR